jgi:RHS repeat-associated protein
VTSAAGTFGYAYLGPSPLVQQLSLPTGGCVTNRYDEAGRLATNRLLSATGTLLDAHVYEYDAADRRTRQTFAAGNYLDYGYDAFGQLTSALGKESGGSARAHEQLTYAYDLAGNLSQRSNNALGQTFNVNSLNQLTGVSRSGAFTVAGMTLPGATNVSVGGNPAALYEDGTYARGGVTLADGANTLTVTAQDSRGRGGTNTVTVTLPASSSCTYDADGNLTSDGLRAFGYDAEDQLITVTVTNAWHARFVYDAFGRRRIRMEAVWLNGAWVTNQVVRYVYDRMLVVQERDGNNVPLATYTRGRDLSGGLQGAGGIGGLLARTENGKLITGNASAAHAYYQADAGGNVTCLLDAQNAVVARYQYDPFGNLLGLAGPLAEANLYRFSSKEFHANSGLYYYGYRFYEPRFQKWLSRDPIGECGGVNLYRYAGNDPLQVIDPFGLAWYDDVADWWAERVAFSKNYLDANAPSWFAATADTVLDVGHGFASIPQAFGHLGGGTGTFAAEPTLENAAGLAEDVSLAGRRSLKKPLMRQGRKGSKVRMLHWFATT